MNNSSWNRPKTAHSVHLKLNRQNSCCHGSWSCDVHSITCLWSAWRKTPTPMTSYIKAKLASTERFVVTYGCQKSIVEKQTMARMTTLTAHVDSRMNVGGWNQEKMPPRFLSLSAVLHTHRAPIEWQNLQHIKVRRHRKIQFADYSVWCGPNQIIACPWRSTAEQIDYSISVLKNLQEMRL